MVGPWSSTICWELIWTCWTVMPWQLPDADAANALDVGAARSEFTLRNRSLRALLWPGPMLFKGFMNP